MQANRRSFFRALGGLGAAGLAKAGGEARPQALPGSDTDPTQRAQKALLLRQQAALAQSQYPAPDLTTNGDEALYPNYITSFTKGLPHDGLGQVDPIAYQALLKAVASGKHSDFESIPIGYGRKLVDPEGAFAYGMEGADAHTYSMPAPPAFASANTAAEMVEMYWHALARDVAFADYASSPIIQGAAADLSGMSDYRGPKDPSAGVTPGLVFRGTTIGDLTGPYISQFLLKPIPFGSTMFDQRYRTGAPGSDYMTSYGEWLEIEAGIPTFRPELFDDTPRYIRNGRDLAQYVHYDHPFQAFLHAALIISDQRPETILNFNVYQLNDTNPYKKSRLQTGFHTFGFPNVACWLGDVTTAALKAAFFQKWCVHRRLRPEVYGGRVYNHMTGAAKYPIHSDLLNSQALQATTQKFGTALLPQAYVEGSPLHPSYPAGHPVCAAALATLLKAMYSESALISGAVTASSDGLALLPIDDQYALTIGNELNKLAYNIGLGRDFAGIHYRSDTSNGFALGEAVAIAFLQDQVNCMTETFAGFQFTSFAGKPVVIAAG